MLSKMLNYFICSNNFTFRVIEYNVLYEIRSCISFNKQINIRCGRIFIYIYIYFFGNLKEVVLLSCDSHISIMKVCEIGFKSKYLLSIFIQRFFIKLSNSKLLSTSINMLLLYLGIAFVVGTSVQAQGQRDCFIVSKMQINNKTLLNIFENDMEKSWKRSLRTRNYIRSTRQFLHKKL